MLRPVPARGGAAKGGAAVKKGVLQRLSRFLRPYALWLALSLALTVAGNLLALAAPLLSGRAVDAAGGAGGVDFPGVVRY